MQHLIAILFITCCLSCQGDRHSKVEVDDEGVIIEMPPIWSSLMSSSADQLNRGHIDDDVTYNGDVLLPRQVGDENAWVLISSSTGEILWEWKDFYDIDKSGVFVTNFHVSGHKLIAGLSNRIYCIDLRNGQTLFKRELPIYVRFVDGIDELILLSGYETDITTNTLSPVIYTLNLASDEFRKALDVPQTSEMVNILNETGSIGSARPLKYGTLGEDIISYCYSISIGSNKADIYLGAYNLAADSTLYKYVEVVRDVSVGANGPELEWEGKVYLAPDKTLYCFDGLTGEKIWEKLFPSILGFSLYTIADGILLTNCEDTYLYAVDANTGLQLWKEKSSGTSSKLVTMNGIVYFTGGGDGLLHAVDIATGQHLWKIVSPDLERNSGAWFMSKVNAIPPRPGEEKGRIIVSSYIGAFAYEAIR